jgi:hypothetical protein
MTILAIDPGPTESAFVLYDGRKPIHHGIWKNKDLKAEICCREFRTNTLVIEGIACYGMAVGKETFDTCIWIGRFIEAFGFEHAIVYRPDVKLHLCKSARAKDANVRQALIDKFGPGKERAIGVKANQGPLYGIKSHCWSALAVAVTYCETLTSPGGAE